MRLGLHMHVLRTSFIDEYIDCALPRHDADESSDQMFFGCFWFSEQQHQQLVAWALFLVIFHSSVNDNCYFYGIC